MNILIAPHPDDCLIGCYSLIKKGLIDRVVYLDSTPERCGYAQIAGRELGFSVAFLGASASVSGYLTELLSSNSILTLGTHDSDLTFLVPDILDNHVLHKATNCIARLSGHKLGYYTTDMNTGYTKELSKVDQEDKRAMLNRYYPDQSSLWENNWKYFLFEGVVFDG